MNKENKHGAATLMWLLFYKNHSKHYKWHLGFSWLKNHIPILLMVSKLFCIPNQDNTRVISSLTETSYFTEDLFTFWKI